MIWSIVEDQWAVEALGRIRNRNESNDRETYALDYLGFVNPACYVCEYELIALVSDDPKQYTR